VANLLLVRATARQREMSIRAALGASRAALVRQLLVESLLLAACGGAAGALVTLWGLDALAAVIPQSIPRSGDIGVDGRVLGFTLIISILAALLFGLAPALHASRGNLTDALQEGSRGSAGGLHRNRLRNGLVVSEIALALVLLIGAALTIQSFVRLRRMSPGFNPRNVLTMELSLPRVRYPRGAERGAFVQRLVEEVTNLPGVESAGVVTHLPLAGGNMNYALAVEGYASPDPGKSLSADYRAVSPGYFAAMGMRLVRGRTFSERDTAATPHVLIVNEAVARRYFGDQDALGRKLTLGFDDWTGEIVGVIRDVRHTALDAGVLDEVYGPYAQTPFWPFMSLALRTRGDPLTLAAAVRQRVLTIDRDQAVARVRTMERVLAESVAQPRFRMRLLSLFGLLALVLATVGIYGVMSYTVTERTREIGVRMALGAQRHDVLRLVLEKGMRLTLAGVAVGLAGAFALARVLQGLLFGTSATDVKTFAWVALGLAAVALLACWLPARRATRVDPAVALRYE
jgi:putative ABC transport system permease protein